MTDNNDAKKITRDTLAEILRTEYQEQTGDFISQKNSRKLLNLLCEIITRHLIQGDEIYLVNLGGLKAYTRKREIIERFPDRARRKHQAHYFEWRFTPSHKIKRLGKAYLKQQAKNEQSE